MYRPPTDTPPSLHQSESYSPCKENPDPSEEQSPPPSFDSKSSTASAGPGLDYDDVVRSQSKSPSRLSLHDLRLECYDECVFNDLPQYLVRISDMRLYSRVELWNVFRPAVVDAATTTAATTTTTTTNVEEASKRTGCRSEEQGEEKEEEEARLRKHCKDEIKRILKYAILSHRWGEQEPEFRDMPSKIYDGSRPSSCPTGPGYQKLVRFCEKASEYGCDYVWSDTCCINKESSSELEEAIRSMYRWYRDAFVCIVHLAQSSSVDDFFREPWFGRGWTLQELLAPERLRMYGKDWNSICPEKMNAPEEGRGDERFPFPNDKLSDFMLRSISDVTGIYPTTIRNFDSPRVLVSTKMRWASKRKTTRIEDVAYSLLGVFDIVMPIAYGEGDRAFRRLLEAIAQHSGDASFFAWTGPASRYSMALPCSPASYQTAISIPYCIHDYAIQKRGIKLKLLVLKVYVDRSNPRYYALRSKDASLTVACRFKRCPDGPKELNPEKRSYAIGVVDFMFDGSLGCYPEGLRETGWLLQNKKHFGMLVQVAQERVGSPVEVVCRRIDTRGVMPLVECRSSEYRAPLRTTVIEHSRYLFI